MSNCFEWRSNLITKVSHALLVVNLVVKTSETECSLAALFFLDFLSPRTDFFLDNIAPQHIKCIEIFICKSSCGWFSLATCIGAMDVLLSAGQCPVCLSHCPGTQGKLNFASGICLELFLLSYFGD